MNDNFTKESSFEDLALYAQFTVDGVTYSKQSAGTAWNEDADGMFSFQPGDVVTVEII